MKNLLHILFYAQMGACAFAQSNLPECMGGDVKNWNECQGSVTTSSGSKYTGEFKNGKFNGQGKIDRADGNNYVGQFKDGWFFGMGTYKMLDGAVYVGEFNSPNGKYGGKGTLTRANGEKYIGELKDGFFHGQGTFTRSNGEKYSGEFKSGYFNGQGTLYDAKGSIINQGLWVNGNFVNSSTDKNLVSSNVEKQIPKVDEEKIRQPELKDQSNLSVTQSKPDEAPKPLAFNNLVKRKALVIGNDSYKSVSRLLNAREDARAIALNLTSVGYQVTLKLDLSEKEMKAALRIFSGQVEGGDEVVFFFAGHGVQLGSTNYLLPTDIGSESEAQVKDEAIQLQRILDDMSDRKARFTLAMIDACRDNPFKSSGRAIGGRGLAPTTAATGQMVIFSAGTGQQALDKLNNLDKDKNGVFTRVFIQEMQKPDQSIDRVVKNVRNKVAELAKSVGHEQVPAIYDQVLGDFYFKKN